MKTTRLHIYLPLPSTDGLTEGGAEIHTQRQSREDNS